MDRPGNEETTDVLARLQVIQNTLTTTQASVTLMLETQEALNMVYRPTFPWIS